MAVTSGFFNSINGDRKYNSLQMGEMFDGIILDGVFATIFNQFKVKPHEGMSISVDTGRAHFEHTWIKNDSLMIIEVPEAEILYDRIDAVVIEVDHKDAVRNDDIKYIKGTPSGTPIKPVLSNGQDMVWQFPLSYLRIQSGSTSIEEEDITNTVGTSECPFVTGPLSVVDVDLFISELRGQWSKWYSENTLAYSNQWNNWYNTNTNQYNYDFNNWFSQLQVLLAGDVAANLANEILKLKNDLITIVRDGVLVDTLYDYDNDPILDSNGMVIEGVSKLPTCHCLETGRSD